jgi:2'-5' RNA ligase
MSDQVHRLFFALCPDAELLATLQQTIAQLKLSLQVRGRWLKPEKLHMTLQFLGDFIEFEDVLECARRAAAGVRSPPCTFTLDHAASFPRRFNPPCVLRCAEESNNALQSLWQHLADSLIGAGLGDHVETRAYVPHLTIAYLEHALHAPVPIRPILWNAGEFCLMDSLVGQSTHVVLDRWALRSA